MHSIPKQDNKNYGENIERQQIIEILSIKSMGHTF